MKKILSILISLTLALSLFSGCSNLNFGADDGKLNIVCTIFPEYDWVKQILGDNTENAELTLLIDNGVDLHSFQPSAQDIATISTCDLFVYVGGESDTWVDDALAQATNDDMVVIDLLEVLGDEVEEEEVVEGMQAEEEEEEEAEGEGEVEEIEYDEHVWLSLQNAIAICNHISSALQDLDADNAEVYKANTASYVEQLSALDDEYRQVVSEASFDTVVFGDRFPFRYLTDSYDLNYYAAFVGCSAETEASFETIIFLATKIDELGLTSILTIENSNQEIANTIIENTADANQTILVMNSMQSTTREDIEEGASYLSIMESNLQVLEDALN